MGMRPEYHLDWHRTLNDDIRQREDYPIRDIIYLNTETDPNRSFENARGQKFRIEGLHFDSEAQREDYLDMIHQRAVDKARQRSIKRIETWDNAGIFGKLRLWWNWKSPRSIDFLRAAGYNDILNPAFK